MQISILEFIGKWKHDFSTQVNLEGIKLLLQPLELYAMNYNEAQIYIAKYSMRRKMKFLGSPSDKVVIILYCVVFFRLLLYLVYGLYRYISIFVLNTLECLLFGHCFLS